ncbi:lipopolysaccharide biosynthesis protein [Desulfocurvibacter africanus]|uniref:lipopolysaccharide biosynthesis protein n=1 Tax=Desulfocurvibacter africanus TaxID=873 RepID=UPI00041A44D0|nr:lipid II flippase MurJ [Desulfocurvibacter africanus]
MIMMRVLRSGSFLTLVDQGIFSVANFATSVFVGRYCMQEEMGEYTLGFTLINILLSLQLSLIVTPYSIYYPRRAGADRYEYTGSIFIHSLLLALCISAILLLASLLLGPWLDQGVKSILFTLSYVILFIMLRDLIRRACFARLEIGHVLFLDGIIAVFQIAGLYLLLRNGLLSAETALIVMGLTGVVAAAIWLLGKRGEVRFSLRKALGEVRISIALGKWVFLSGLLWLLSISLYPWLLAFFHNTAAAGVWGAAMGIVGFANPVILGVQNYLGPKMAHHYAADGIGRFESFIQGSVRAFFLLVLPMALGLWFFGENLLSLIYGQSYSNSGPVVQIMGLDMIVTGTAFCYGRALFVMEKAKADFLANVASFAFFLTIGILLVKMYGAVGVALGMMLGNAIASSIKYVIFRSQLRIHKAAVAHAYE